MHRPAPPTPDRRRTLFTLRGLVLTAVGALLFDAGPREAGPVAITLLIAFAITNVGILVVPRRWIGSFRLDLVVGLTDLVLVGLGIHLAGASAGALPISCLLMVLVTALGNYRLHMVAGAAAVGALHAWLVLDSGAAIYSGRNLALQILFLCGVGLYYGFLADGLHRSRRKEEVGRLERTELLALLDILDTVTSSLDSRAIARSIVTRLAEVIPAVRCSLLVVDRSMKRCRVVASHDEPDLEIIEIDLQKYPEIRKALETRSAVVVKDVATDPLMAQVRGLLKHLEFHSILVVPLVFADDVLGSLCLKAARSNQEFTMGEVNFCTAVAKASANAFKNALLHDQVIDESSDHRVTIEKLSRVLDHSPDLILTTDNDGRITEFNREAERISGHPRTAVVGRSYRELFREARDNDLVAKVVSAGQLHDYASRLTRSDGGESEIQLNLAALRDESDEAVGSVWLGRDVTELKATQTQLQQAEKLSTIGEVISGVAHELNNPLSGVLGFSQILMARDGAGPMARELEKINESAMRCQKIVKNLLSFARGHTPERTPLGVNGILEKTLDLKKYQLHVNSIEVVRSFEPDLPMTMLDFHQMQQVLLNLINNAQQAMAAVRGRPGRLEVRTSLVEERIRIEITDNGEGMDAETQARIFEPFFTTKEKSEGTGLGLSVSYGIVREHEGRIWCRSRKGEGTTFIIDLPVLAAPDSFDSEAVTDGDDTLASRGEGASILVVDDEPVIIDLMLDILRISGHRVDTAANGGEACRKVKSGPYDLVITDVRMPEMNGIELYRNIIDLRPEMKGRVIFVTGDLIDPEILEFLGEINAKTLAKPLDINDVTRAVVDTLEPNA
jgi:two-component system NtrC family sensor kinase